mgnify:CR=1 FL=1
MLEHEDRNDVNEAPTPPRHVPVWAWGVIAVVTVGAVIVLSTMGGRANPPESYRYDVTKHERVEPALVRFEGRIASPMLSDITRGLIGVLRGDDGRLYFQMLSHDLKQQELQRLKARAAKIPPKIRVFSFIMLACFMLTYVVVLAMVILDSMALLF